VGIRLLGVARLVEADGSPLVCRGGGLECRDRLPDEAGNVHLGDPEAGSDLGLREILLEAQSEDDALAVGERVEQPVDERGVIDALEAGLFGGEEVDRVIPFLAERLVERVGVVGGGGGEGIEDLLGRRVGALGEFGRGG
jgi:hypothetical protein